MCKKHLNLYIHTYIKKMNKNSCLKIRAKCYYSSINVLLFLFLSSLYVLLQKNKNNINEKKKIIISKPICVFICC